MTSQSTQRCPLDQIDPLSPEFSQCPFPHYARLQEEAPVWKVPGKDFYLVTSHADIVRVCQDPGVFSNDFRKLFNRRPEVAEILAQGVPDVSTLATGDPPEHRRYKVLVSKALTPSRVKEMVPAIERAIEEQIDTFIDAGEVELTSQFSTPVTMQITADQLGVPRSDYRKFKEWSDARVAQFSMTSSLEDDMAASRKRLEFQAYFAQVFREKGKNPTNDIISMLATTKFDDLDRGLTTPEFLSIAEQLMTAGNLSATHAFSAGMVLLLETPALADELTADPAKWRPFIEEMLRLNSPVAGHWRVTTRDVELGGVTIPAGSGVHIRYAAGNLDEKEFAEPQRLDLGRPNQNKHLAFGLGEHFCPGSFLGRKELELGLKALLSRLRNVRFTPGKNDFTYNRNFASRGLNWLHLSFDRG